MMKHLFWPFSFLFFVPVFLDSCHLATTPDELNPTNNDCATNKPSASFLANGAVNTVVCDKPCTVVLTNTSSANAVKFRWFSNGVQITTREDTTLVFPDEGIFDLLLIALTDNDCADSSTLQVQVNPGISKFKTPVDVSAANAFPLAATERADGKFHLLFTQNGLKSILVNRIGMKDGNPVSLQALDITPNVAIPKSGGFVVGGEKTPNAKIAFVSADQTPGPQAAFAFGSPGFSTVAGMTLNANDGFGLAGYVNNSGAFLPGFANANSSALVSDNKTLTATGTSNYGCGSLALRPSSGYFISANCQSGSCSAPSVLFSVSGNGGFNKKITLPLIEVVKIIRMSGDNYAIIGYAAGPVAKVLGFNGSTEIVEWERTLSGVGVADIYFTTDGKLMVCGSKQNGLYLIKFPPSSGTNSDFEKTIVESGKTIDGYTVVQTADGGVLALGSINNAGEIDLFLVKTDVNGNFQ